MDEELTSPEGAGEGPTPGAASSLFASEAATAAAAAPAAAPVGGPATEPPQRRKRGKRIARLNQDHLETKDAFRARGVQLDYLKQGISKSVAVCFMNKKHHRNFVKKFHSRGTGLVMEGASAEFLVCTRHLPQALFSEQESLAMTPEQRYRTSYSRKLLVWRYVDDMMAAASGVAQKGKLLWREVAFDPSARPANKDCYFHTAAMYKFAMSTPVPTGAFGRFEISNVLWVFDPADGLCRIDLNRTVVAAAAAAEGETPKAIVQTTWYPHVGRLEEPFVGLPFQFEVFDKCALAYVDTKGFFIFPWEGDAAEPRAIMVDMGEAEFGVITCMTLVNGLVIFANMAGYLFSFPLNIEGAVRVEGRYGGKLWCVRSRPSPWSTVPGVRPYRLRASRNGSALCMVGLDHLVTFLNIQADSKDIVACVSDVKGMANACISGPLIFSYHRKTGAVLVLPSNLARMPFYHVDARVMPWVENFPHCEDPMQVVDSPSGPAMMTYFNSAGDFVMCFPDRGGFACMCEGDTAKAVQSALDSWQCTEVDGEVFDANAEDTFVIERVKHVMKIREECGERVGREEAEKISEDRILAMVRKMNPGPGDGEGDRGEGSLPDAEDSGGEEAEAEGGREEGEGEGGIEEEKEKDGESAAVGLEEE